MYECIAHIITGHIHVYKYIVCQHTPVDNMHSTDAHVHTGAAEAILIWSGQIRIDIASWRYVLRHCYSILRS